MAPSGSSPDALNGVVIGLLSSLGSALLIGLIFVLIYFFKYTNSGRILLDRIGRPGEYDDEQAFAKEEAEALETMDDMQRSEYLRAKGMITCNQDRQHTSILTLPLAFVTSNPPESLQTDISLSQYLAIQEKGVSAWEFEPELEIANCFVEGRTEIEFFDSECTVMTNLPVPKQNEVYYWEAKIYEKPESTLLAIGMATKPYPLFRLPGMSLFVKSPFILCGPSSIHARMLIIGGQASTGTRLLTFPMASNASISLSIRLPMRPNSCKAMSLVAVTAHDQAAYSLLAMARSWTTSYTA